MPSADDSRSQARLLQQSKDQAERTDGLHHIRPNKGPGYAQPEPTPRWDVHFGILKMTERAPRLLISPLGSHWGRPLQCGLAICTSAMNRITFSTSELRAWAAAVNGALEDRLLSLDEENALARYAKHFSLSHSDLDHQDVHKSLVQGAVTQGIVPDRQKLSSAVPFNLMKSKQLSGSSTGLTTSRRWCVGAPAHFPRGQHPGGARRLPPPRHLPEPPHRGSRAHAGIVESVETRKPSLGRRRPQEAGPTSDHRSPQSGRQAETTANLPLNPTRIGRIRQTLSPGASAMLN